MNTGSGVVAGAEQALLLAVALDQRDQLRLGRPVIAQVAQRLVVDREEAAVAPNSGDMLAIVARSAMVSDAKPGP